MTRPACTYLRLTRAHLGEPWRAPGHQHGPMALGDLLRLLAPDGWRLDCIGGGGEVTCGLERATAVVLYRAEVQP